MVLRRKSVREEGEEEVHAIRPSASIPAAAPPSKRVWAFAKVAAADLAYRRRPIPRRASAAFTTVSTPLPA